MTMSASGFSYTPVFNRINQEEKLIKPIHPSGEEFYCRDRKPRIKNSWVGVIMHGGLNAPGFIAVCFSLL